MSDYPLKGLTKALNDPKVLDYCNDLYVSFTTVEPPKSYDELHKAVRENFPYQLTVEKPDTISTVKVSNDFNVPLYKSLGSHNVSLDIRVDVLSKSNNDHHRIDLRSYIYTDYAQDTPLPINQYNDAELERLSDKEIDYLIEAVQQTVDAFVKTVTTAQV